MRELETSLESSRKPLLALDLAGIVRGTVEQVSLVRKLDAALRRGRATHAVATKTAENESHDVMAASLELSKLEEEIWRSRGAILDSIRLQAALLVRAQRKLRVLGNMLAGPSIDYGPLLAKNGASSLVFGNKRLVRGAGRVDPEKVAREKIAPWGA
jgi:hypothetical protein